MLLDAEGRLAVMYKGAVPIDRLIRDAKFHTRPENDTRDAAVPMPGRWYVNQVPADLLSVAEKLLSASLPASALRYLDDHLLEKVLGGSDGSIQTSVWTSEQIADIYLRTGIVLAQQQAHELAEQAVGTAIELAPELLAARAAMANLLEVQLRYDEALAQYDELLQRQPNNPLLLNNVAWILASSKDANVRNPVEAVSLAEKACEITEYRLAPTLDTLAAAYVSAGRFEDAAKTIRAAIDLARKTGREESIEALQKKLEEYTSQGGSVKRYSRAK